MSKKTGFKQGRLGIGTNDPKYPLDVIGDIRLTGAIRDGSGRLIVTTANSNQNAELYNGWKNDASGNLYLAEPGQVMKIGINKIPIETSSALDISGGLIIDKLYSKNGGNQDFNTESILEFTNLYVKNKLSNQAGEIKDTDISSTSLDDGETGWLWTANNYLKSEPGIQTIDISADVIMDGITRNEDHKIKVEKSLFAKNVIMTKKITADNDLNLNGMLTVSNDFRLEDNLNVNNIDISTNLTVEGNLKSEHVLFTKQTTIHDLLDASNIDVSNTVVNNDTVVENSIHATGDVSSNDVSCNNLFITNELTATHIDISNNLLIRPQQSKKIDIENKVTVLQTVDVSYVHVYTDIDLSENMVIDKNMDISAGKLNKHLDVSGIYVKKRGTVKNLKIREKAVMKGQVDISGNLNMKNRLFASSMVGMIGWFASENIPPGWLVCDGGKYTKALYTDLSNCIGNTYNAQDTDGDISFNVPDLTNQFVRSIYTDTDTDIRLGAKENYKTGKPTQKSNFHVTLSGEHIHNIQLSGSHRHDYNFNSLHSGTNIDSTTIPSTNVYIDSSKSRNTNNQNVTIENNITGSKIFSNTLNNLSNYSQSFGNWHNISTAPSNAPSEIRGNTAVYMEKKWDGGGGWKRVAGNWGSQYDRPIYWKQYWQRQQRVVYDTKSWKFINTKYKRISPSYNENNSNENKKFLKDIDYTTKDITFDKSGNHTHVVDDKENTHSHTLSNWDTESVPKHTILLPCIKY